MIKSKPWAKKPIVMPGVYSGIPLEIYHSAKICGAEPSISSSGLRTIFAKSPAHYWCSSPYNPERIETEETSSMLLGRAAHHLLLGEKGFQSKFVIRPDTLGGDKWNGNRTACKLWMAEKEADGLTVLSPNDAEKVIGISKSLAREPLIKAGILNGAIEQSFFWKDGETGVWLRARPDAIPSDGMDFCDLKLTSSVLDDDLRRTIHTYGYFQQAALVASACDEVVKRPMASFTLVFVESAPPYCVRCVTLKDADIVRGVRANRAALQTFAKCLKDGHWPGPGNGMKDAAYIEMRAYDQKEIDARLSAEQDRA